MGSIYLENFIDMKIFRDSFWLGRWVQAIFIPWKVVSILLVLFVMSNVDYAKLFSWCGLIILLPNLLFYGIVFPAIIDFLREKGIEVYVEGMECFR